MKIQNKLFLSFGLVGISSIILGIINIQNSFKYYDNLAQISNSTIPKIVALQKIKESTLQLLGEAYSSTYIKLNLPKNKFKQEILLNELEQFETYSRKGESYSRLLYNLSQTPEEKIKFKELENNQKKLYAFARELKEKKENKNEQQVLIKKEQLEDLENSFLTKIDQLLEEEQADLTQEEKNIRDKVYNYVLTNSIFILVLPLSCGLFCIYLCRKIVNPILKVQQAVVNLGQGRLDVRVEGIDDINNEIGILAKSFNETTHNLKQKTVSQRYIDNIMRSMIDALIILKPDKTIKNFNLATFLLLGYEHEEDLLGKSVKILFKDEEFLQDLETDKVTKSSTFIGRKETTLISKTGQTIPVYFSASVMRDERGNIEGFVCLAQDISDRKRAEASFQELQLKWRSVLETIPDIIIMYDNKGVIQYLNKVTIPGVEIESIIGCNIYEWIEPQHHSKVQQATELVFKTGQQQSYEILGINEKNTYSWYATRVGPVIKNGEVIAITASTSDITERRKIEQALRESEERLENLLNSLTDVVWSLSLETYQMVYMNQAAEQIYGRPVSEFLNNPNLWLEVVHPEDLKLVKTLSDELFQTGYKETQYRIILPNGKIKWLYDRAKLVRDDNGTPIRIEGIASDCTDKKIAQDALEKANEELEIRVQERTRAIKQANKLLQKEIAERQVVSEALRQSEERVNSILDSLDDIVWSVDVSMSKCIYISPAIEKIYGRPLADFYKDPELWQKMVHPDDQKIIYDSFQIVMKGETAQCEFRVIRPDSEIRWLQIQSRLARSSDGQPMRIDGISSDITARKAAETQLKNSELRFKKLAKREALLNKLAGQIRHTLDIKQILDTTVKEIQNWLQIDRCTFVWYQKENSGTSKDSVETYWNVAHEACNSNDLGSYLGKYLQERSTFFLDQLLNQKIIRIDDYNLVKDSPLNIFYSQWGYKSLLLLPIHTLSGEMGLLACGHHTGTRPWKNGEISLLQAISNQLVIAISQAELYHQATASAQEAKQQAEKLQEAMKALQKTQAQLIQTEKMSSLGQMVAGIAHEINNPVSFIYGNVGPAIEYIEDLLNLIELYQSEYNPTPAIAQEVESIELEFLKDDLPKLLVSMKIGADRIRQIVLSLRNFSRLDEAEMKAVNLHEGIDSTLLILQNRLKAKGDKPEITVIKSYGKLPEVECFAGQVNQVFMNILANGIDALESYLKNYQTGPEVNPQISITTSQPDQHHVRIVIADNGPGIKPATISRIFDPFFTTKPVGSGTGLGLSISYQIIVEKHKGDLKCVSTLGVGTEFIIELPVRQDYAEPALFK